MPVEIAIACHHCGEAVAPDEAYVCEFHTPEGEAYPVVFLHDPWFGFFGRRDVLCLWSNAGRRELGLPPAFVNRPDARSPRRVDAANCPK